jgi:hypothetical protein
MRLNLYRLGVQVPLQRLCFDEISRSERMWSAGDLSTNGAPSTSILTVAGPAAKPTFSGRGGAFQVMTRLNALIQKK